MTTLRAIVAVIVLILAAYIAVMNWGCVIASEINRRKGIDKHHSVVPALSLIFAGVLAYPLYPFTPKWWIGLIPAFDIGTWVLIIGLPWAIATGMFKKGDTPNQSVDGTR